METRKDLLCWRLVGVSRCLEADDHRAPGGERCLAANHRMIVGKGLMPQSASAMAGACSI